MIDFLDALLDGDVEAVRQHLRFDAELATTRQRGASPLFHACGRRNPQIVGVLLQFGADPNDADEDGETPLHVAAYEGDLACVELLLAAGATVAASTFEGKTPLMNAAQSGQLAVVQALLAANAVVGAKDLAGRTALHWSIVGAHDEPAIVRALLQAGADRHATTVHGDAPTDYARTMGKTAILHELLLVS